MSATRNTEDDRPARRFQRRPVTRFVWFHTIEAEGDSPRHGISYSVDLSRGGLGLVTTTRLDRGTLMMVQIAFDNGRYAISAVCRVAYCREGEKAGSFRLGLEFVVVPPDASGFIAENFS